MLYVTDIPDWVFVEAGFPVQALDSITSDQLAKLAAASPLQYASQVRLPDRSTRRWAAH